VRNLPITVTIYGVISSGIPPQGSSSFSKLMEEASSSGIPLQGASNSCKPVDGEDLKLVPYRVGRLHLGKTRLCESTRRKPKSQGESRHCWGRTATGTCYNTQAETTSHVLCECEVSAELRPCCLGKHFMDPSNHVKIPLWKYWWCGKDGE
jgi:hypothetical protein